MKNLKKLKDLTLETTYKNDTEMALKIKYNQLLEREKKASDYFDSPNVDNKEKDKHIPTYFAVIKELDDIWEKIGDKSRSRLERFEL